MKLEIILALLENLKCAASVIFFVWSLSMVAGLVFWSLSFEASSSKSGVDFSKKSLSYWPYFIFIGLLIIAPTPDQLWKVRISLIKLELSSPENLSKASSEIERIGHELECKYLGCKEQKK